MTRENRLTLRLTEDELKLFRVMAAQYDRTLSDFVRYAAKEFVNQQPMTNGYR